MTRDFRSICGHFNIPGDFVEAIPYGTGHINDTYRVEYNQAGTIVHYTLQRINTNVFKDPESLMENIARVTEHIGSKNARGFVRSRQTLTLLHTSDGKNFYRDEEGNCFRMYLFIEQARTYDIIASDDLAYQAACAFGRFASSLADIPGQRLHETIPAFHDTPSRLHNLEEAIRKDTAGRKKNIQKEIDFFLSRGSETSRLIDLMKSGDIPERITHNDTKLNNVLIDDTTGEGICVIDLDTCMPGLAHYDFGDMVRSGTSPCAEDEPDSGKVFMQFNRFEALLRGYLAGAGSSLNKTEKELLPFAGKLITFEIGMRFLTDYLDGDIYFKTKRPDHNLDRCRTHIALVSSIEQQMEKMNQLVKSIG